MFTALPRAGRRAFQAAIAALVALGLGLWWLMSTGGTPAPGAG